MFNIVKGRTQKCNNHIPNKPLLIKKSLVSNFHGEMHLHDALVDFIYFSKIVVICLVTLFCFLSDKRNNRLFKKRLENACKFFKRGWPVNLHPLLLHWSKPALSVLLRRETPWMVANSSFPIKRNASKWSLCNYPNDKNTWCVFVKMILLFPFAALLFVSISRYRWLYPTCE